MAKTKIKNRKGFTMVELMITTLIASIIVVGIAAILADGLRHWRWMYSRQHTINSTSASFDDAYQARLIFDTVVRNASVESAITDTTGNAIPTAGSPSLKIYYYSPALFNTFNVPPDCYATFSYTGTTLTIQCSKITGNALISSQTVNNLTNCVFKQSGITGVGAAIQMLLTLQYKNPDNGIIQTFDVTSSAFLNCN